ncbi:MAG: LacI family DNA-binding transcriptional regulator [Eubacteriales bacterium]|nr:LacI family DNA-binding transcriptional regulator [Eubacteriales bacterium]
MATIKDIAKQAGVSFTTVSNVIHGNTKKVSPATIEKVEKLMKEMNYVPNMGARMLVRSCSKIIGVIASDMTEPLKEGIQSPFMAEILGTMEREIRTAGYYMMLCFSDSAEEIEKLTSTWNVDGVITVSLGTVLSRRLAKKVHVPAVYTDCYFDAREPYINVGTEDEKGARDITEYLLGLGHRKLLFISDVENPSDPQTCCDVGRKREEGFLNAMKDAGLGDCSGRILRCANKREEKELLFEKIIARKGKDTALVFCNDYFAIEGIDYLRHKGIHVPKDFSVTGFDDINMAGLISPRLTTVHQGVSQKGRLAVKHLLALIENKPLPGEIQRLPVNIVIRESAQKIQEKV